MTLDHIQRRRKSLLLSLSLAIASTMAVPLSNAQDSFADDLVLTREVQEVLPTLPVAVDVPGNALSNRRTPIVIATEKAESAVVNIQGNKTISTTTAGAGTVKQEVSGMGTGVIIDPRGYIITNLHVVQDVPKIEVTLPSGRIAIARLLKFDSTTDLALIKVDADQDLPVIPFGTSHDLYRGETVIAIGNPFGYQNSVTVGIISALHRDVPVNGTQEYKNLIQTSADINPGNSGGPLININGEVIGINVAVRVGAQGIGFAIPIDDAVEVMSELIASTRSDQVDHGLVLKPEFHEHKVRWRVQDVHRNAVQLTSSRRTEIANVKESQENVRAGDILVNVAGSQVPPRLAIELATLDLSKGDRIEVQLDRNGQLISQNIDLIGSKASDEASDLGLETSEQLWTQLGLRVEEVSADQVRTSTQAYQGGLRITAVRENSPAAQQKLAIGDSIVGVLNWQTPTLKDIAWVLNNNELHRMSTVKFFIVRDRRPFYVPLAVGQNSKAR